MIADSSKPNKLRNVYTIRSTTRNVTIQKIKIYYIKIKVIACPTYCILQLFVFQVRTYTRSIDFQSKSESLTTENVLPFTDEVIVVLEHKSIQCHKCTWKRILESLWIENCRFFVIRAGVYLRAAILFLTREKVCHRMTQ